VSEYAAKNIAEDMPKVLRFIVLTNAPSSTDLVKDQKISEFYNYESLPEMRTFIRENLGADSFITGRRAVQIQSFRGCKTSKMMRKYALTKTTR